MRPVVLLGCQDGLLAWHWWDSHCIVHAQVQGLVRAAMIVDARDQGHVGAANVVDARTEGQVGAAIGSHGSGC